MLAYMKSPLPEELDAPPLYSAAEIARRCQTSPLAIEVFAARRGMIGQYFSCRLFALRQARTIDIEFGLLDDEARELIEREAENLAKAIDERNDP